MIYLLVMIKVSLICHQYFITKISTTFSVTGVRLHPYLRPLRQSSLFATATWNHPWGSRDMIIYTFLVNETAAIFQLLHISMCNLKYVTPLSGAVLITRWLLRMTVVHVGLPQYNKDQTQFLLKQLLLQSETKNMTWKNNNKIICGAKIRVPKEGMKQYQNLHKLLKKQVWSINPLSDCGR